MAVPGITGIATGKWQQWANAEKVTSKKDLLRLWDQATENINSIWPTTRPQRFNEIDKAFGQWEGPVYSFIFYGIDREIHHRGQAYVCLRSPGIEPPAFYGRS